MEMTKTKIWLGLGSYLLASVSPVAMATADTAEGALTGRQGPILVADQGGEGGERGTHRKGGEGGEGGEGGKRGAEARPATDDVSYLTRLGLVRGHLNVGFDLYQQGAVKAAKTHMKHPGDELYADLKPAFAARGVAGFADQLEKLASLVEKEAPISAVKSAYSELESAIDAAAKGAASPDVKTRLEVAEHLVRTAAEEYAVGVKGGKVVNAHEYQDALGFVRIAKKMVTAADADSKADAEALERAKAQFERIESAWPGVVAPKTVDADASIIYGAADWIEIAAMKAR